MSDDLDLFLGTGANPRSRHVWTEQQQKVFAAILDADSNKNVRINASAGSAKSTTIIEGARRLPSRTSATMMAFNKNIKKELESNAPSHLFVRTFHGAGFSLIKSVNREVDLDEEKGERIAQAVAGENAPRRVVNAVKNAAKFFKLNLVEDQTRGEEILEDNGIQTPELDPGELTEMALRAMSIAKDDLDTVDYDDQIWLPIVLNIRPKFKNDIVFVDEAQDMNESQLRIVQLYAGAGRTVAVYDPMQAIYEWRGAGGDSFQRMISSLNVPEFRLSICFRCPKKVIEHARQFVPDMTPRPNAPDGTVGYLHKGQFLKKLRPGDVVISRTNAELIKSCTAALRQGIRSNIVGRDLGRMLTAMVTRSKASTIEGLRAWTVEWAAREVKKRVDRGLDTAHILDRAACINAFAEITSSISDMQAKIANMFDDSDDSRRVLFSSTHRFKGLERDRVFLLWGTYMRKRPVIENDREVWEVPQEEKNLAYVAITRSRSELYYVDTKGDGAYA